MDDHWVRHVMNDRVAAAVEALQPQQLSALEISGAAWQPFGFKEYRTVEYPDFDICSDVLPESFDVVIAEQVFEHIRYPYRAAANVLQMLRPGGTFVITTPFLIRFHPAPHDYWRWTPEGLAAFLEDAGFEQIVTDSWGNRECLIANLDEWPRFEPGSHGLDNEPAVPLVVWGFARRPGRRAPQRRRFGLRKPR